MCQLKNFYLYIRNKNIHILYVRFFVSSWQCQLKQCGCFSRIYFHFRPFIKFERLVFETHVTVSVLNDIFVDIQAGLRRRWWSLELWCDRAARRDSHVIICQPVEQQQIRSWELHPHHIWADDEGWINYSPLSNSRGAKDRYKVRAW